MQAGRWRLVEVNCSLGSSTCFFLSVSNNTYCMNSGLSRTFPCSTVTFVFSKGHT